MPGVTSSPRASSSARHQRHAHQAGMRALLRHFPQAVVRGKVSVGNAQFGQPPAQQPEMARLVGRDAGPVEVVLRRHCAEAEGRVEREVDGVELDVRDGVQQRRAALDAAQATRWQFAGSDERRPRRSARVANRPRRSCLLVDRQRAAAQMLHNPGRRLRLLFRIAFGECAAQCFEQ